MNANQLNNVLRQHQKWLNETCRGKRADLCGENLRNARLSGAALSGADLSRVDLTGADLQGADLSGANLSRADLQGAVLAFANLRGADLSGADLRGAYLCDANLIGASLCGADLCGASLFGTDFTNAKLCRTDLRLVNIDANTKLDDETMSKFFPLCCPEVGAFIGWKKIRDDRIVKLLIPEDAQRSSAFGRKCRCSRAIVLEIERPDGMLEDKDYVGLSLYDFNFTYKVGETITPDSFDPDRKKECSYGIHFFLTKEEAVHY